MRIFGLILLCFMMCGCNSVYLKPHTLDTNALIYTPRAGYSMARSIKEVMDTRGYDVSVGKLVRVSEISGNEMYQIPNNAKYAVNVKERSETLRPIWCAFNGFWWWNFNVSVINRTNNEEILSWRGRGCANSSIKKLNEIFDELENKLPENKKKKKINIRDKDSEIIETIIMSTSQGVEEP